MLQTKLFPPLPDNVDPEIVQPSSAFKEQVWRVISLILLFLVSYFALLIIGLTLGLLSILGGVGAIFYLGHFFGLMIGLGLIGLGIMLIVFIFKSLIIKPIKNRADTIEITPAEEPLLFEFIRRITEQTHTKSPAKIFLTQEVNASVSYNRSFLSSIFPTRKNLYIGLGLVNSLNISEFNAVIAHEFGHFAQRSMRFGNYVHHVNQVIYNMLYEDEGYNRVLEKWGNVSGYFALFAALTIKIIKGIRWLMGRMYPMVNKGYMGLSREMEFHADAVAASVSGSKYLANALYKMELSDRCFNFLLEYYTGLIPENLKSENLYLDHTELIQEYGQFIGLDMVGGIARLDSQKIKAAMSGRVVITNDWDSHPAVLDRERHLNALNIVAEEVDAPAWQLFNDPAKYQLKFTNDMYESIKFNEDPKIITAQEFRKRYGQSVTDNNYQSEYKGYFDSRLLSDTLLTFDTITHDQTDTFDKLFAPEYSTLQKQIGSATAALEILIELKSDHNDIRRFELDGVTYDIGRSVEIAGQLESELVKLKQRLHEHDQRVFSFFSEKVAANGLLEEYTTLRSESIRNDQFTERCFNVYNEFSQQLQPMYETLPFREIDILIEKVKEKEKEFKLVIGELLQRSEFTGDVYQERLKILKEYHDSDLVYFTYPQYNDTEVDKLNTARSIFVEVIADLNFVLKKKLLQFQLDATNGSQQLPEISICA